jgi:hypothetical protein
MGLQLFQRPIDTVYFWIKEGLKLKLNGELEKTNECELILTILIFFNLNRMVRIDSHNFILFFNLQTKIRLGCFLERPRFVKKHAVENNLHYSTIKICIVRSLTYNKSQTFPIYARLILIKRVTCKYNSTK